MAKNNSVLKCLYRSEFLKDGVFIEKEETMFGGVDETHR